MLSKRALSFFLTSVIVQSFPTGSEFDPFLSDDSGFMISSSITPEETSLGLDSDIFNLQTLDLTNPPDFLEPSPDTTLLAFTNPDPNAADYNLFDNTLPFNHPINPETDSSPDSINLEPSPEYYALIPDLGDSITQKYPGARFSQDWLGTYEFPAICGAFTLRNPQRVQVARFEPTYGEGGFAAGSIKGYSTAWYSGYMGSECGKPESWFCCIDPVNGNGCVDPKEFYSVFLGRHDYCEPDPLL